LASGRTPLAPMSWDAGVKRAVRYLPVIAAVIGGGVVALTTAPVLGRCSHCGWGLRWARPVKTEVASSAETVRYRCSWLPWELVATRLRAPRRGRSRGMRRVRVPRPEWFRRPSFSRRRPSCGRRSCSGGN
jgi:hypothetical protein